MPADRATHDDVAALVGAVPAVETTCAHRLLGWSPRLSSAEALGEPVVGMPDGAGTANPPLRPARGTAPG
ncbi:MAG: hypothetical protein H7269_04090 [Cellulomonas sp.]|nr:hypothetical protein [Cellulomonas sp.]